MNAIGGGYRARQTSQSGGKSSGTVTLQSLQKQYPELRLSVQPYKTGSALEGWAEKQSAGYSVAIDPKVIERMNKDPKFAKYMHGQLSSTKSDFDRSNAILRGAGMPVTGTAISISVETTSSCSIMPDADRGDAGKPDETAADPAADKDGAKDEARDGVKKENTSVQWGVTQITGDKKKDMLDRLDAADDSKERLEEKRLERKEEEKRLEKRRALKEQQLDVNA
jgi:hypothetical protein